MPVTKVGSWKYVVHFTKRTYQKDMTFIERLSEDYVNKSYLVEDGKYLTILEPVNLYDTAGFRSHVDNMTSLIY